MTRETFEAGIAYEGERLDKYLNLIFSETDAAQSRSFFQKLIKEGHVLVNDTAQKANYRLKADDMICVEIPDAVQTPILPENIPLDILYEDDDLLVVNKPKGMVVHPSAGHYTGTLVNAIMYHCRDSLSGINGEIRPGIVHRIDMDTTGSLIVCKNDESHVFIAEQIKEHSVNRRYRGIVYGVVKEEEGTVNAPIGRHPIERKKMAINEKNGKPAITHYKVLERFERYTYMEFKLETGRTHQIRVHMASIGHPLLGDTLYSSGRSPYKLQGQTHRMLGKAGSFMGNKIYTIGREFGSGGREIGEKLAERLGIKLYDKELLQQAAKESGFCEEIFENHDEKPTSSFLYSLVMDTYSLNGYHSAPFLDMPLNHKVFLAQFDTIKKIAERESCVIVGRCADYALSDNPDCINIFIHADMDKRVKIISQRANITESKARDLIQKQDKQRASYYNYYTSKKWGDSQSYHLTLDSGKLGIDGCIDMILKFREILDASR